MPVPELAVIIPVYNPSKEWADHLLKQFKSFQQVSAETDVQLVIINDGSTNIHFTDEINTVITGFPNTIILQNEQNKGKGYTLRKGVTVIKARYYIVTDVDMPYTTNSMVAVYKSLTDSICDIAAGNRNKEYYHQIHGFRRSLSLLLRTIIKKRLHLFADDTQCGLKGFNETGKQLFLQTTTNRYLYDLEFMVKACNHTNIRLQSVPVFLRSGIVLRSMSLKILVQESGNFLKIFLSGNKLYKEK